MKWAELVVGGMAGGLVATLAVSFFSFSGNIIDILSAGLRFYVNSYGLILSSAALGWLGGRITQSSGGAFMAGLAVPLIYTVAVLAFS
jgi:hypothetical protein